MKSKPFDIQRRVVAHKTSESWDTIPHVGIVIDLDVTAVRALVEKLRITSEYSDVRLTINSVMLKLIAESIKNAPDMNAYIEYNRRNNVGNIHYRDQIDIAMPMMTPAQRMITPVLRDVGGKSLREVCEAMEALARRANNTNIDLLLYEAALKDTWQRLRKGHLFTVLRRLWANFASTQRVALPSRHEREQYYKIPETDRLVADDLLESSFLVTNIGSLMPGLRCHVALMEIIPPAVAAFGLAGVQKQAVVRTKENGEHEFVVRDMMPFTCYGDHRALDFVHGAGFLKTLLHLCEHPEELL